jgi:hypothetical protein
MVMACCCIRAALHLEAGPIRCVRGLKSSVVIGQEAQISPNSIGASPIQLFLRFEGERCSKMTLKHVGVAFCKINHF